MAKATVFYEDYARVVTPTSKNVVLEYKGENSACFTFNVDISGKNADKYSNIYQNIPTQKGKDLVITTIFFTSKMQTKTVTTTIKDYFDTNNLLQGIEIKNNFIGTDNYVIDRDTVWGKNGLYAQVSDSPNNDYILAPDLKEAEINLDNSGMDFVYDNKGNDKYKISASTNMFFELNGNDGYFITNESGSVVIDTKGNDQYDSKDSSMLGISDFVGNDKYLTEDNGRIIGEDFKGNDQYELYSNERSEIHDYYGQDKYYIKHSRPTNGAPGHQLTDYFGNDYYEIENSWALSIKDDKGKDKYIIKNIDTSSTEITVSNFAINDSLGNDKYELANVKSKYGQVLSSITDKLGNDKYTVNGSNYFEFLEHSGKDTYNLIGTEENKVSNFYITDYAGNDKYTLEHINKQDPDKSSIVEKQGNDSYSIKDTKNLIITDELGNDKYTLQNRINGYINDYDGKDTYTSKGETTLWELSITDSGTDTDTYTLNGGNLLSITDEGGNNKFTISNCYESGIKATGNGNDTYKYTNMNDCWIDDSAGNDKYTVDKCRMVFIEDIVGNDTYKFTEADTCYITDESGNDKYNLQNCYDVKITDESGDDTYTIDIKGIKNGHHYIEDYGSDDGDTLTIKGLSTKNIMYLSDYDKDGNATGDMIIFDKSTQSYIQIDSFFNYSTEFNVFEGDFEYGQIETIKVGGKKLDIDAMEMSTYLDNISITVGNWLSANSYDDVCTLFDVGKEEDISNFIAYMTES